MRDRLILIGDNPFHGVSHLSRERSLSRSKNILNSEHAAEIVLTAVRNGANGFTFTVSETTLDILRRINRHLLPARLPLYPLIPNVNEMIRLYASSGGISGMVKNISSKIASVMDYEILANGAAGLVSNEPDRLFKAYLKWEYLKLMNALGKGKMAYIASILLHEIATDMALALDMPWLFRTHIEMMRKTGLKPGFETRNLPYMVKKFTEWQIDLRDIVIEAPFNPIGFQMCPLKAECEEALDSTNGSEIIAFSILAAGHVRLPEALNYINGLPGLRGLTIGVSSEKQAIETFSLAREILSDGESGRNR